MLSDSSEYTESAAIYLPNTRLVISGLLEGSSYQVVGVSKDGSRTSSSEPKSVTTMSSENVSHLNQGKSSALGLLSSTPPSG